MRYRLYYLRIGLAYGFAPKRTAIRFGPRTVLIKLHLSSYQAPRVVIRVLTRRDDDRVTGIKPYGRSSCVELRSCLQMRGPSCVPDPGG